MADPQAAHPPILRITVHMTQLPTLSAMTDGQSTIWLDERLTKVEARCALMHEIVHIAYGHAGHQPPMIERKVRAETARRLIPFERLLTVRHWQGDLHGLAEDLGVTDAVLHDRLRLATVEERAALEEARAELAGEC